METARLASQFYGSSKFDDEGRRSNVGGEKEERPQASTRTKSNSVIKEVIDVGRECEQGKERDVDDGHVDDDDLIQMIDVDST